MSIPARFFLFCVLLILIGAPSAASAPSRCWEPDRRLTSDPGASQLSFNFAWSVAADEGNRIHVVWHDDRDGASQIYYKRSDDDGASWGPDTRLSSDPAPKEHPAIAVSGSSVYVVWHDMRNRNLDIYFKRSLDGGTSWEQENRLSIGNPRGSAHASIAAAHSNVYVVWGDHRDGDQAEIYFRASYDGGTTWGEETRISELPFDSWVPTVTASGWNVYVAWVDTRDGNEEEYFRRSTDGGLSWAPVARLTDQAANSWAPSLAASGDTVHMVWFDQQDSPVQPQEAENKLNEAMDLLGLKYEPVPSGVMVIHPEEAAKRRATEKLQLIQMEAPAWVARGGDAAGLQMLLKEFAELAAQGASYMAKERKL
ncbi:MAG TPA: sialidase family protein, partial [Acidobacteriota bacterium]